MLSIYLISRTIGVNVNIIMVETSLKRLLYVMESSTCGINRVKDHKPLHALWRGMVNEVFLVR